MSWFALLATSLLAASPDPIPLGFETLASFRYEIPDGAAVPAKPQEIPKAIRDFDGQHAAVTGFMIPVDLAEGRTRRFVLARSQASCCYGVVPMLNEYVLVTMTNEGARPIMDVPVTVVGKLKVGETYEDGLLVGLYQMDGQDVVEAKP